MLRLRFIPLPISDWIFHALDSNYFVLYDARTTSFDGQGHVINAKGISLFHFHCMANHSNNRFEVLFSKHLSLHTVAIFEGCGLRCGPQLI